METLLNSKVGFAIVAANSMKALNVANAGKLSKPHNLPTLDLQKGTVSPFAKTWYPTEIITLKTAIPNEGGLKCR